MMEGERYITDPSTLTTAQLFREIGSLKELLLQRIEAVEEGIEIAHQDLVRVPTDVQKQVGGLKELLEKTIELLAKLNEEKFGNLEKRLDLVEQARIEQKKDTATAVDAALKAAKEAVTEQNASNVLAISKTENNTTKQIEQVNEKIDDVKERLTRIEGVAAGITTTKQTNTTQSNWMIYLVIMAGIAIIGIVIKFL